MPKASHSGRYARLADRQSVEAADVSDRTLAEQQGWRLQIVKRRQRVFKITGLTWIIERGFRLVGTQSTAQQGL